MLRPLVVSYPQGYINDRRFPQGALTHKGSNPSRALPITRVRSSEAGTNESDQAAGHLIQATVAFFGAWTSVCQTVVHAPAPFQAAQAGL